MFNEINVLLTDRTWRAQSREGIGIQKISSLENNAHGHSSVQEFDIVRIYWAVNEKIQKLSPKKGVLLDIIYSPKPTELFFWKMTNYWYMK